MPSFRQKLVQITQWIGHKLDDSISFETQSGFYITLVPFISMKFGFGRTRKWFQNTSRRLTVV